MAWDGILHIDGNEKKLCKNSPDKFNSSSHCSNKPNLKEKIYVKAISDQKKIKLKPLVCMKIMPGCECVVRMKASDGRISNLAVLCQQIICLFKSSRKSSSQPLLYQLMN